MYNKQRQQQIYAYKMYVSTISCSPLLSVIGPYLAKKIFPFSYTVNFLGNYNECVDLSVNVVLISFYRKWDYGMGSPEKSNPHKCMHIFVVFCMSLSHIWLDYLRPLDKRIKIRFSVELNDTWVSGERHFSIFISYKTNR